MKTFFQKLLLSIPLRPEIAVLFSFIIGYLGLFLPMGYIEVTYTENTQTSEISLPIYEKVSGFLNINNCPVIKSAWLVKPNWFLKTDWRNIPGVWTVLLATIYYLRFVPESSRKLKFFFFACVFFMVTPVILLLWSTPNYINCLKDMEAIVHNISVEWIKILSWAISLPLGIYALYKREMMVKNEISS